MTRSIFLSLVFHSVMIVITALRLPFMGRAPVELPTILSVELIQITDTTSIPFAAKAAKILEEIKKKRKKGWYLNRHLHQKRKKKNLIEFLYQRI